MTRNDVSPQRFNEAMARAWEELGQVWHEQVLPKKFSERARSEYGYQRRSRAYVERKRRRFGHSRPLEYTGKLKRMVLRPPRTEGKAAGDRSRGQVTVSGPAYLRARGGGRIDYAQEIRALSAADERFLDEAMGRLLEKQLET